MSKVGNWIINFGKYKEQTWESVVSSEQGRNYCRWLLEHDVIKNKTLRLYIVDSLKNLDDNDDDGVCISCSA